MLRDRALAAPRPRRGHVPERCASTSRSRAARAGLEEILAGGVVTLFQPIVDLSGRHAVGHEVFSRGPAGGPFEDGERLFALASRFGRLLELERLCRRRAALAPSATCGPASSSS